MGKLSSGILGPVSGKVGNVVGGSWRGIDYLRAMPASVSNPRSPAQLNQRARFLLMLRFLQPMLDFIKIGFKAYARKMSAYNAAMSHNLRNAITGTFPDFEINYSDVLVSRGNLRGVSEASVVSPSASTLQVQWEDNSGMASALAADRVMVVVYNDVKRDVRYDLNAALRSDGEAILTLPAGYSGDEVQVWIAFTNLSDLISSGDSNTISNSIFAGSVAVL
jgi:hypothetical protein